MEIFTLLVIIFLILLIPTAYAGFIGAPYVPTFTPAIKQAFDYIKLGREDTLIDLGAGDGRVLIEAARRGANALGYELSPIMWAVAWFRALGHKRIKVKLRNFYKVSLTDVCHAPAGRSPARPAGGLGKDWKPGGQSVVFTFLIPKNMPKVRQYLAWQTIPSGKYFLVYAFPLPKDVKPLHVVKAKECAPLYIYDLKGLTK